MSNPETHTCCTCGYTWMTGKSGSHRCADILRSRLEDAMSRIAELEVERDQFGEALAAAEAPNKRPVEGVRA